IFCVFCSGSDTFSIDTFTYKTSIMNEQTIQTQPTETKSKTLLNTFRKVATIEGISMVLLVICSVLKRTIAPELGTLGVKYIGWAHGLLFVAYVYLLAMCWDRYKWSF